MAGENKRTKGVWWAFPFHQLLSTVGVPVLGAFLTFTVSPPSEARWILTETPYFPVQIALALVIGFGLPRFLRHWLMEWVWALPFSILCVSFILTPLPLAIGSGIISAGVADPNFAVSTSLQ